MKIFNFSFGENTKLLHSFKEPFNEDAGAHILHEFSFEQKKTHIAKVCNYPQCYHFICIMQ